ncbi:MAG: LysM peptidoglycan-binding domain-containing protein [Clostridiales bacterium]|jgi:LysM repeat protein|nr:LysM peptidoglycan-binding domain-containing protein [Clostridiales bacterium]
MEYVVHRFEKGDTLERIAKKYGVPVSLILRDNNLDFGGIEAFFGLRLLIRRNPGTICYAQPFDTIESIAERHGVTAERVRELNEGAEEVFFGQVVYY